MRSLLSENVLSWIILLFAATNIIFIGGIRKAFGGYVAQLHKEFSNVTLMELNWISDSYAALSFIPSAVTMAAIFYLGRRYALFQFIGAVLILFGHMSNSFVPNPHWMFLTHTILNGIGTNIIMCTIVLIINEHFDIDHPYHILATTCITGGSISALVFVSFYAFLIQKCTWRHSFRIIGGMFFVVQCSAVLFFRKKEANKKSDNKRKPLCSCDRIIPLQYPMLFLWCINRVITMVVMYGLLLNLTDYIHRSQPDLVKSSILTTSFAAGEGLAYLIMVIVTALTKELLKKKFGCILLVTSLLGGASLIALEYCTSQYIISNLLCFLTGISIGSALTLSYSAGEELTGMSGHKAYPFTHASSGIGTILSPLLTAKIAELFHYKWFFLVQGCFLLMNSICNTALIVLSVYYRKYYSDMDIKEDIVRFDDVEVENNDDQDESKGLLGKEK